MRRVVKAREKTDLAISVPTLDNSLAGFSNLRLHWIDPNGSTSSVSATASNTSYARGLVPYASVIAGDWSFWAEGDAATGEHRATFAHIIRVKKLGEVE